MTEQEIIEYLKENKTRGIVFDFFPEDVQNWCRKYRDKNIFEYFQFDRKWAGLLKLCPRSDTAYCLKSDYIPEIGFKEHWQEFEIDKDGFFRIKKESYTYYCWFNWQKFLEDNFDKYNNFGGWFYEQDKTWNLTHQVLSARCSFVLCAAEQQKVAPVIPTKIRFWRYRE